MCREPSVGVTATNVANGNAIVIATVRLRLTKYLVLFAIFSLTPPSPFAATATDNDDDENVSFRLSCMYCMCPVYAVCTCAWKMQSYLSACVLCVFMAKFHVEFQRYFQLNKGGFYAIYLLCQHNNGNSNNEDDGSGRGSNNNNKIEAVATVVVAAAAVTATTTTTVTTTIAIEAEIVHILSNALWLTMMVQ